MSRLHFCCVACGSMRTTFCTLGLQKPPCTCPSFMTMDQDCKGPLMESLIHIYDALNHIRLQDEEQLQLQVHLPLQPDDANVTNSHRPTTMVFAKLRRVHCSVCSTHVGYKYVKLIVEGAGCRWQWIQVGWMLTTFSHQFIYSTRIE